MNNNNKWLWALVCLLILIAFGGYVYTSDPFGWRGGTASETQQSAEAEETKTQDAASSEAETENKAAETETASETATDADSEESKSADAEAAAPAPTFDLVRVEPDGSTLIAGQASPGAEVEVVSNGQVIATAKAGVTGDFAAVLDNPLPVGDHQIVLRSKGDDSTAQSEEVATISIPESDPSELLVMVTKPGEASRILTKPEVAMAAEVDKPAAAAEVGNTEENQAAEDASSQSTDTQVAAVDSDADAETSPAASSATTNAADTSTTTAAAEDQAEQADAGSATKGSRATANASDAAGSEATTETASLQAETSTSENDATSVAAVSSDLRIDAVEIEDGRIFVAGQATAGGQVRVYVDGEPIGSSGVSQSGRFLVEARKDLAVGDHTISAELIMQSGAAPVMRVAVPFARPEGQMVAAVAASGNDDQSAQSTGEQGTQVAAASQNDSSGSDTGGPQVSEDNTLPAQNDSNELASAQGTETPTVVQPALQQQDNSVIIRRGDTLWQISRRIYGQGVRYTTIYLANDHLMDHPDLIEPGQIFAVPETPVGNAEELHREHVRNKRN